MGDISLHFDRSEFRCQGLSCCGHAAPVARELVGGLEELRARLVARFGRDVPIGVSCGFRCPVHNAEVPGADPESYHQYGEAADIQVEGVSPRVVAFEAARVPVFRDGGIGVYPWGVHVDVRRSGPARWFGA